jgi:hypothetical protein
MITLLLHLLRLLPFLCSGHRQLALENLALRQQLAVYKRTAPRPRLRTTDRLLWVWLARVWPAWRQALVIVAPATVLSWQRRRFRRHWATLSGRPPAGRPRVDATIKALVRSMAAANLLWGAPRIHGELLRLGIGVLSFLGGPMVAARSGSGATSDSPLRVPGRASACSESTGRLQPSGMRLGEGEADRVLSKDRHRAAASRACSGLTTNALPSVDGVIATVRESG